MDINALLKLKLFVVISESEFPHILQQEIRLLWDMRYIFC